MNNIPALVQNLTWCRPGDKPLSEAMVGSFTDAYMHHSASMSQGKARDRWALRYRVIRERDERD